MRSHLTVCLFPYGTERDSKLWRPCRNNGHSWIWKNWWTWLRKLNFQKKFYAFTYLSSFFQYSIFITQKKNESGSILYAYGKFVLFRHISFLPWNNVKLIPKNVKLSISLFSEILWHRKREHISIWRHRSHECKRKRYFRNSNWRLH